MAEAKNASEAGKGAAPAGGDAKDQGKDQGKDKGAAKKKNPKLLMLIIAAAVVLLLGAGAAYYFLVMSKAPDAAADPNSPEAKNAAAKPGEGKDDKGKKGEARKSEKPVFVEADSFTVNMKDPDKFLQIKLTFQVKTADAAESIKDLMPIVRAAVIPVLSGQDPSELATAEGKEKLCTEVAQVANKALAGGEGGDPIDAVLITHMIMQ